MSIIDQCSDSHLQSFLQNSHRHSLGAMVQHTLGLAHMLATVPDLLDTCLSSWHSRGAGIRQLRLVSRETGSVVLLAVRSCSLQIGEDAHPDPCKLLQLLSRALLTELTVSIMITSGGSALKRFYANHTRLIGQRPSAIDLSSSPVTQDKQIT